MPTKESPQLGLFDQEPRDLPQLASLDWPKQDTFPLNLSAERNVGSRVIPDLVDSKHPLIVTGFAALDHIIDLIDEVPSADATLRLLFGSEPFTSKRDDFTLRRERLPAEAEKYWLDRGISLLLSGKIVRARTLIKEGRVVARYLGSSRSRLHAKMYCGDDAITVGSSNFTTPGMRRQIEANVRFTSKGEKRRFSDAQQVAENFWHQGDDYNAELDALLEKLLKLVTWEEALARGCAELLDGEWAREYLRQQIFATDLPLWPSQVQGIAQALWLIDTVGSVLVADATGSGKTRMGAHLLRSVVDRIWSSGRIRKGRPVMICPPSVENTWEREATLCGVSLDVRSHGLLSRPKGGSYLDVREALRRAQILAVDEAHNFLNPTSTRTKMLLGNMADHTVLFTATPINKSVVDLLRLADMLGADNLDDSTLEMFDSLLRRKVSRSLTPAELDRLRSEIQRFTVRRTKSRLNAMVEASPDAYRDEKGRQCRYPEHRSKLYSLSESDADRQIAAEIRTRSEQLSGIGLIVKEIQMPDVLVREGWTEQKYLNSRLLAAKKLAGYLITAALRSSRAALLEHLVGTATALAESQLPAEAKRQITGDQIAKLTAMSGKPPGSALSIAVPGWLIDPTAHRREMEREAAVYRDILKLCRSLSVDREVIKAQNVLNLLETHDLVIAFDSRPITLAFLEQKLASKLGHDQVILATGEHTAGKQRATKALALGSKAKKVVALCSDSMSEGLNLQQASSIIHLDMPSVVRVAEQRVGRVDRMDSPHDVIEAWWPEDAEEFSLRSDERLVERLETVESLLGSNMPMPPELSTATSRAVRARELVSEYEGRAQEDWDGLQDAFAPVRSLVEGHTALIAPDTYSHYRHTQTRVVARVSVVASERPWAFFCVAGSRIGAPHWVLVDASGNDPITSLERIVQQIRQRLGATTQNLPFDDRAAQCLSEMLERLSAAERLLLPRRKQRALEEMQFVLQKYRDHAAQTRQRDAHERLQRVLAVFGSDYTGRGVDWNSLAEKWLDLIRPVWYAKLIGRHRWRPLRLRDIRQDLIGANRLDLDAVLAELEHIEALPPLHERVASCILGLGPSN